MATRTIAAGAFKQGCLRILDEVAETHREVVITKRGKAVAKLVPVRQEREREEEVLARLRGKARLLVPEEDFLRPLTQEAGWNLDGERWPLVVLDTHAAVWWAGDPTRLGRKARTRIETEDRLRIPSIVFWEVALLVRKRKLDLGMSVGDWADAIQSVPRVETLPLTAEICGAGRCVADAPRSRRSFHLGRDRCAHGGDRATGRLSALRRWHSMSKAARR